MESIQYLRNMYYDYEERESDSRLGSYPFMQSPLFVAVVVISYLLVAYLGPQWMSSRKPLSLTVYNKVYNILQILLCTYFVVSMFILTEIEVDGLPLGCKRFDRSISPKTAAVANLLYLNFVVRFIELSETVVHVLRKKTRNVSFLHVYHHSFNFFLAWWTAKYAPGGTAATICLLNYAVHMVMYTYYLCASHNNIFLQKLALKCKKYITAIQMGQFIYMFVIVIEDYFIPKCKFSSYLHYLMMFHLIANLLLFTNFYRQSYRKKKLN